MRKGERDGRRKERRGKDGGAGHMSYAAWKSKSADQS